MSTARTNLEDDSSEDIIQLRRNLKLETHRRHKENKVSAQEISKLKQEVNILEQKIKELNHTTDSQKNVIDSLKKENRVLTQQNQEITQKSESIVHAHDALTRQNQLLKQIEHANDSLTRQNHLLRQQIQEKDKASKELLELAKNPTKSRMIHLDDDENIPEEPKPAMSETKSNPAESNHGLFSWFKKQPPKQNSPMDETEPPVASLTVT